MKLKSIEKILKNIEYKILNSGKEMEYTGMEYDSRKIMSGNIFAALDGNVVDGHDYIKKAISLGAKCILVSKDVEILSKEITYILVEDLRLHLGIITSNFYNWPQKNLKIIGVTGTNGKTTITYILDKILKNTMRIGTVEYKIGDEIIPAPNTTPESMDLVKMCKKAVEKNIEYLVMEVSSHALEMGRVEMLDFDAGIFTNLTPEHMDYHKTIENYYLAKRKLFTKLKDSKSGIYNVEDTHGKRLYDEFGGIGYGEKIGNLKGKIISVDNINQEMEITYEGKSYRMNSGLLGRFNLMNILGAIGGGIQLGLDIETILERLKGLKGVPGRFETVDRGQNFMVVVDYAHTEDALKNILTALNEIKKGRIITVFGCGGDRDTTKRPKMAETAELLSDFVVLTSDNPRTEDPESILNDVEKGFKRNKDYIRVAKRERAIAYAISMADKDDIILIAGKGHEDYQIIGREKIHFDDREIAGKYIEERLRKGE
ncbi:MAG: UDP-N-acetylmuramoyl-L-alanyl-D-glutamate--2,6-diaminopimelate ligase [Fusobacteriia bacterium 4572_74]|nr:MAG: UDP-N-acetylmuramoyl-L-alanyl-D-glutamate--2,6-diaminopimelate ligase [Fusobacteriia bacterium 4572_74]